MSLKESKLHKDLAIRIGVYGDNLSALVIALSLDFDLNFISPGPILGPDGLRYGDL